MTDLHPRQPSPGDMKSLVTALRSRGLSPIVRGMLDGLRPGTLTAPHEARWILPPGRVAELLPHVHHSASTYRDEVKRATLMCQAAVRLGALNVLDDRKRGRPADRPLLGHLNNQMRAVLQGAWELHLRQACCVCGEDRCVFIQVLFDNTVKWPSFGPQSSREIGIDFSLLASHTLGDDKSAWVQRNFKKLAHRRRCLWGQRRDDAVADIVEETLLRVVYLGNRCRVHADCREHPELGTSCFDANVQPRLTEIQGRGERR